MSRKAENKSFLKPLALAVAGLVAVPFAQAASVSIENPSFESKFDGWDDVDPSAISKDAYAGSKSAKITGSAGLVEQSVSVEANTNYILSAYVLESGTIGVEVDGDDISASGGGDDWEKVEVSFNSGSDTSVTIYGAYGGDTGRIDSFALESSTATPEPTAEPTAEPTQDPGNCTLSKIDLAGASDDGTNDGHGPELAIDNGLTDDSRWSSKGDGKSIEFDLGGAYSISSVSLAWYKGDARSTYFDIETSEDGSSWTSVLSNAQSSGSTAGLESHELVASSGYYLRLTGYGNSAGSLWNS